MHKFVRQLLIGESRIEKQNKIQPDPAFRTYNLDEIKTDQILERFE